MNRALSEKNCSIEKKQKPFRKIVHFDNIKDCSNMILGSSLVFGVCHRNTITISCPGGAISTMKAVTISKKT